MYKFALIRGLPSFQIILDFLNNRYRHAIDSRCIFRFYPWVKRRRNLQTPPDTGLRWLHLTGKPLAIKSEPRSSP